MSSFRNLMARLRAGARIVAVSSVAVVIAASCQGNIGGGAAGSGGPGGDGSGGTVLGRGGSAQGSGGYGGSGGAASGGTSGTGGRGGVTTSGTAGASGSGGASSGTAGASGSGGASSGTAGVSGSGGASGDGGSGDGGPDATFTALYASLFGTPLCAGTLCHSPGIQKGIDLSSQRNAYESLKFEVVPGDGANSALYRILVDGTMPPDPPKAMSNQLAAVRAWIDAGALNN